MQSKYPSQNVSGYKVNSFSKTLPVVVVGLCPSADVLNLKVVQPSNKSIYYGHPQCT